MGIVRIFSKNVKENQNMEDELKENSGNGPKIKTSFLAWLDNFWYHYKWHSLASLFAIIVVITVTLQMCSKPSYDIHVMYAGAHSFDRTSSNGDVPSYNSTVYAFNKACDDFNGDGKITVDLLDLFVMTSDEIQDFVQNNDGETVNENLFLEDRETLHSNLIYSEYFVCFLSEALFFEYEAAHEGELFAEISQYTSEKFQDSYEYASANGIYLRSLDFYSIPEIARLPDDTVVCIRKFSEISSLFGKQNNEKQYENSQIFLSSILSYEQN